MRVLMLLLFVYTVAHSTAIGQNTTQDLFNKLEESYNFGPKKPKQPKTTKELFERLEWIELESCHDLTLVLDDGETLHTVGGRVSATEFIDLACEIEQAGNKITHAASWDWGSEHKLRKKWRSYVIKYYMVDLNDGNTVVLHHEPCKHNEPYCLLMKDNEGNRSAYIDRYHKLYNPETGRYYDDTYYKERDGFRSDPPTKFRGSVDGEIASFLLGKSKLDLWRIGIE